MISKRMAQEMQWNELAQAGVDYCFVITHVADFDSDEEPAPLVEHDEWGPANASEGTRVMAHRAGQPWRVLDGDDNVCAVGIMWASDSPNDWTGSQAAFAPLHDYGVGEHGATTLQYLHDGEWRTL